MASTSTTTANTCVMVTDNHLNHAVNMVGTKMLWLSDNQKQALVESDTSFITCFEKHAINRNVNIEWVQQMKVEIMKMAFSKECTTLTLAIHKDSILTVLVDFDENEANGGFKAIILDGQHRWEAMMQLKKEMPDFNMKIMLVIYIVENEDELLHRLRILNKRLTFTQEDNDKVNITKRFIEAFNQIVTPQNMAKRCIQKVKKSAILQSDAFTNKHKLTTVEKFNKAIIKVSNDYYEKYTGKLSSDSKFCKSVTAEVIKITKLYQLVDDTCAWISEI